MVPRTEREMCLLVQVEEGPCPLAKCSLSKLLWSSLSKSVHYTAGGVSEAEATIPLTNPERGPRAQIKWGTGRMDGTGI